MPENELLESLILAYPCPIKWETMSGDERKRFCEKCSMHVFNISDLSKEEAESFLKESLSSESVCVKFFLRRDGTIKTNNCPKIFRSIYSRILWFGAGFSYVSMLLVAILTGCSKPEPPSPPFIGGLFLSEKESVAKKVLNPGDTSEDEAKWLLRLQSDFKNTRQYDLQILKELKRIYTAKQEEVKLFRIKLFEVLLKGKGDGTNCDLNADLLSLEEERQKTIGLLMRRAVGESDKNKYEIAWRLISECIDLAACESEYNTESKDLPEGVSKWTLVKSYGEKNILVASKSALLETIELLKKLESKVFPAALLKEQLQAALRIEEFKNAGNEKAIREIEKITSESAQRNELVRSDVIFLTTEKNTKRLSAVKYLDSYKIIEYLKVPTKSQLPTRYVESREDFLTLDEDSPISAYPAMDSKFRYLVCITNPEYDGDAVKHSGKDFILIKSPTDNELNLLKETIKNASDRKILQCQ
ncbi:MAG: hypothetical protein KIT34_12700 [Cyanobacteria bacterium TGS_CYA1]|nr:hypothetical protein [Cyanobacteria bacterium TGS_CYA1]